MCLCRHAYDAFLVVHGTDTMAYTASALSLMLVGKSGRLEPESGSQLTCTLAAQVPVSLDIQQVSMHVSATAGRCYFPQCNVQHPSHTVITQFTCESQVATCVHTWSTWVLHVLLPLPCPLQASRSPLS